MAKFRFELSPGKPNCVRASARDGTIEFESPDHQTAQVLLNLLNSFVSDIAIDRRQSRSMDIGTADWLYV